MKLSTKIAAAVLLGLAPLTLLSGCGGGKPSQSEVRAGLVKFYVNNQHVEQAKAERFADCVTPKFYAELSDKTLKAMADGDPTAADPADAPKLAAIASGCASNLS